MNEIAKLSGLARIAGIVWIVLGLVAVVAIEPAAAMVWLAGGVGLLTGFMYKIHALAKRALPKSGAGSEL